MTKEISIGKFYNLACLEEIELVLTAAFSSIWVIAQQQKGPVLVSPEALKRSLVATFELFATGDIEHKLDRLQSNFERAAEKAERNKQ